MSLKSKVILKWSARWFEIGSGTSGGIDFRIRGLCLHRRSERNNDDFRIALANLRFPSTPEHSMPLIEEAIAKTGDESPGLGCFRECYVPGYPEFGRALDRRHRPRSRHPGYLLVAVSMPAMMHNCSCARTRNLCLTFSLR
jgi:hypothetical protein